MSNHKWKFFRAGGFDQVQLDSGADLMNLDQLDQKLWVALACPTTGLEFDSKTLALIDTDGDGRVRVPEIIAAIKWAAVRLKDAGVLLAGTDGLPVEAINSATPEGRAAADCAREIVARIGRAAPGIITVAEAADAAKLLAATPFNGDGVIMPQAAEDEETKQVIVDIIACLGGTADRGGAAGVTREQITAFHEELAAFRRFPPCARRSTIISPAAG